MLVLILALGCGGRAAPTPAAPAAADSAPTADVTAVSVSGAEGAWTFAVTIRSDETGCDRYADWWEVLDADGRLLYRRILRHSHPDEQPFTRSGGPVPAGAGDTLVVRAHLHPDGYGGAAMRGTPGGGFSAAPDIGADFAASVAGDPPQPEGCLF